MIIKILVSFTHLPVLTTLFFRWNTKGNVWKMFTLQKQPGAIKLQNDKSTKIEVAIRWFSPLPVAFKSHLHKWKSQASRHVMRDFTSMPSKTNGFYILSQITKQCTFCNCKWDLRTGGRNILTHAKCMTLLTLYKLHIYSHLCILSWDRKYFNTEKSDSFEVTGVRQETSYCRYQFHNEALQDIWSLVTNVMSFLK